LTRIRTRIAAIAFASLLPVTIAACGGGSSATSSESPQQVLHQTFSNPKSITSGKLDLSLTGNVQGSQSASFSASVAGPFASGGGAGTLPQFDLTGKISGSGPGTPSISFEGGLVFTKNAAYVEYQGTAYKLPSQLFSQFKAIASQSAASSNGSGPGLGTILSNAGVKPSHWFTNLSNEGTADVAGTTTDHISGDVDVAKVASDLQKLSQLGQGIPGQAQTLSPSQLSKLKQSVKSAHVDIYSGQSDHLLRKLAVSLDIAPPGGGSGGVSGVSIDLSLTLSELNQPQTISAPANAQPVPRSFLQQLQGLGSLGAASSIGGGTAGNGSPSGGLSAGTNAKERAYTKCLLQASGKSAAINKCLQKLAG
jgi:hypothetical protein